MVCLLKSLFGLMVANLCWIGIFSMTVSGSVVPLEDFAPVIQGDVALAIPETDGSFIIAGNFTAVNGTTRRGVAKLRRDGTLGEEFARFGGHQITTLSRLSDGTYLIAGRLPDVPDVMSFWNPGIFVTVYPYAYGVAVLKPDGSVIQLAATNLPINSLVVQDDGKIIIGGYFTMVNGVSRMRLARLFPDGTVDPSFDPQVSGGVQCLMLQPDGRIVMGGAFTTVSGANRSNLARLEPDGRLDVSFTVGFSGNTPSVLALELEKDGALLVGGMFLEAGGNSFPNLARIKPDGTLDAAFRPNPNGTVNSLAVQTDGGILLGGDFSQIANVTREGLARLSPSGDLDNGFDARLVSGTRGVVSLALDESGLLLASGVSSVDGTQVPGWVVLDGEESYSRITVENSTLCWERHGTLPEVFSVEFESRAYGSRTWQSLGAGGRTGEGWELVAETHGSGMIRAVAEVKHPKSGYQIRQQASFGHVSPFLVVTDPAGVVLGADPAAIDWGWVPVGFGKEKRFGLENLGNLPEEFSVSIEGENASEFSVMPGAPGALAALEQGSLGVRFRPISSGPKSAVLRISGSGTDTSFAIPIVAVANDRLEPVFRGGDEIFLSLKESEIVGLEGTVFGGLVLEFAPSPGEILRVIDIDGPGFLAGEFAGLPQGGLVTSEFGGISHTFRVNYHGGDGNDLTFMLLGSNVMDAGFGPNLNGPVTCMAIQPDKKVVVGGIFNRIAGHDRERLARIYPDGTLDSSFKVSASSWPESISIQNDGSLVVAASLYDDQGNQRNHLGRIRPDGTLDLSFVPVVGSKVTRVCVLRNGKILIGGGFGIYLLNSDGIRDSSFQGWISGTGSTVYALAEQEDGKILVGGIFTSANSYPVNGLVRFLPNGQLDSTFKPGVAPYMPTSVASGVSSIVPLRDGKILVGGYFSSIGGGPQARLARLNSDGTLDRGFTPEIDGSTVICIRVQSDGRIMIGGRFHAIGAEKRAGLGRLNGDGSLDGSFQPQTAYLDGSAGEVWTMVMAEDGELYAGGYFGTINGTPVRGMAKFLADEGESVLQISESNLMWRRSGALGDLEQVRFEWTGDSGRSWEFLGAGERDTEGDWKLAGYDSPGPGYIRVIGRHRSNSRFAGLTSRTIVDGRDATALEKWRERHFGVPFNKDSSANLEDPDHDGVPNLLEFAFGLNPRVTQTGGFPEWHLNGDHYETVFSKGPEIEGLEYSAEWSESLAEGDWHSAEDLRTGDLLRFRVPDGEGQRSRLFFRFKVTGE